MSVAVIVSDALDGILVGAVLAAIGYVAKELVASVRQWRREDAERRVRLVHLQALLAATDAGYTFQSILRDRLYTKLRRRFPDEVPTDPGYERLFVHFYDRFDRDEQDLHSLVRAYTQYVLQPLNAALRGWLKEDVEFRTSRGKTGVEARLGQELNTLDAHLLLWLAKYEMWIPEHQDHALVYLADEEKHGVPFPQGIEDTVDEVLVRRGDPPRVKSETPDTS